MEIGSTISTRGDIYFENFKQWWILRKTDFETFKNKFENEIHLKKLLNDSIEKLKYCIEEFKKEASQASSKKTGSISSFKIVPNIGFDAGLSLNLHVANGNEFMRISNSFSNLTRESPVTFGLELNLNNEESGPAVLEALKTLQQLIPRDRNIKLAQNLGFDFNYRQVGTSLFVDISTDGEIADKLSYLLSILDFSSLNFSGESEIHVSTKISIVDFFKLPLDEQREDIFRINSFS
jgi:hypothetical protein